jgi:HK97 family phage major capsid protein
MGNAVLDKLREERDQARSAALAMAEAEDFNPDDATFVDLQTRAEHLDKRASTLNGILEQQAKNEAMDGRMARTADRQATPAALASPGDLFTRSEAYSGYAFRGTSGRFYVDADAIHARALPTGVADLIAAGYKGTPTRVDTTPPVAPTPLLDSVSTVNVSGNAIEFVAWGKVTGGAAKVVEKAAKPPAEFAPTVTSATLDTIAVYTQLTRQLIEDEPAARSAIDNLMTQDVVRAEEAEAAAVLAAATGVIPDAASPDSLIAGIRMGVGVVQAAGFNPTAVLLNPIDWAAMDVAMLTGTLGGAAVRTNYWGLTLIPSTAQAVGTAVVGDFRAAVSHYVRSQVALYITDSHADTFLSNVFTLLAERRAKTVVVRPQALCECTGPAIVP